MDNEATTQRKRCLDCYRPVAHCLCDTITTIGHATEILILQHPRERSHPFNTARVVERCLERAEVLVNHGGRLERDPELHDRVRGYGLLYPGPDARDLAEVPETERPKGLVVIDGTWHHARAMYRDLKALHDLPRFTLPAGGKSGFKIRKQPQEYCLSTLEAIHSALACIEPETPDLAKILKPFHAMQSIQLGSGHDPSPRKRKRGRDRRGPRLPAALKNRYESLVVVYGEVSPIRCEDPRPFRGERPLLTLAAERPATGEHIQFVLRHPFLNEDEWQFLRLSEQDLRSAIPLDEATALWSAFLREGDVVAAWNQGTFEHMETALPPLAETLFLKETYYSQRPHRGMLEDIVASEMCDEKPRGESRTAIRLANSVAIAKLLQSRGETRHDDDAVAHS